MKAVRRCRIKYGGIVFAEVVAYLLPQAMYDLHLYSIE